MPLINPYAIYLHCDGSMDYDSKNSGGVGFTIDFPEGINLDRVEKILGKYEGANIERLELNAIFQGMKELLHIYKNNQSKLKNINTVIVVTDRFTLNDSIRTNPYKIKQYRKNGWKNHESKAIKNDDLLEQIDKTRRKIIEQMRCFVKIEYQPRKNNRNADKLAKLGKTKSTVNGDIRKFGNKIGKRKYDGAEVNYRILKEKEVLSIYIFRKELVGDQWEINADICSNNGLGNKIKIYTNIETEKQLHRGHIYNVKIKRIYTYHITIYKTINETKDE